MRGLVSGFDVVSDPHPGVSECSGDDAATSTCVGAGGARGFRGGQIMLMVPAR